MGKARRVRGKRKRRQMKQAIKHGQNAKPRHTSRSGRTGGDLVEATAIEREGVSKMTEEGSIECKECKARVSEAIGDKDNPLCAFCYWRFSTAELSTLRDRLAEAERRIAELTSAIEHAFDQRCRCDECESDQIHSEKVLHKLVSVSRKETHCTFCQQPHAECVCDMG